MVIAFVTALTAGIGLVMLSTGARLKPKQASFQGIVTLADLIRRIDVSQDKS